MELTVDNGSLFSVSKTCTNGKILLCSILEVNHQQQLEKHFF